MTTKSTDFQLTGTASIAALALGAGLGGLDEAEAAIIFTDLDATISDETQTFDIDGVPLDDLKVFDETGVEAGALVVPGFYLSVDGASADTYLNRFDVGDTINLLAFKNDNGASLNGSFFKSGLKSGLSGLSPWLDGKTGFFGFLRTGEAGYYFGYVEARFEPDNTVFLGRAAFETDPNTPITIGGVDIPAPGTLGLLAVGAAGLLVHRRRPRRRDG